MNLVVKVFDFWLGDFKWYRNLTEGTKTEWLCRSQKTFYGGNTSNWERHPKGTYFMINVVKQIVQDNPNMQTLNQNQQREIVQKYLNEHYGSN